MARTARIVVPGLPHHIYQRGNNRRRLFSRPSDKVWWTACLAAALDQTACALHQITLMENHVHMVVTPPTRDALAALMKRACQRYAQRRNQARESSGKLFEERYHSKVIEDDEHLMTVTLYGDANAFRAGIVEDPLAHEWSTGPLHAGREGSRMAKLWTPSVWYRRLGDSPQERSTAYAKLMTAYAAVPARMIVDGERETADVLPYERRVERPDRKRAR